jgi:hypothetical protein
VCLVDPPLFQHILKNLWCCEPSDLLGRTVFPGS